MFDINGTFLIVFVSFIAFVVVMKALFFDPLMKTVTDRQSMLDNAEGVAQKASKRRYEVDKLIQDKLHIAYQEAQRLNQQQTNEAREKASALKLEVKTKTTEKVSSAVAALGQQAETSYQALQPQQAEIANLIIEKIAGKTPARV